jgi:hypothetical protein
VASLKKIKSTSIQLEILGKHFIEPCDVADEFSKHLQSVCNNPCPVVFHILSSSSEFLSLTPVCDSDSFKAIKRLRPSTSVGVIYMSGFDILTWRLNAGSAGRGFAEHVPVAKRKAPLLDGELLEHVSTVKNTTEEAMHCIQSNVDSSIA